MSRTKKLFVIRARSPRLKASISIEYAEKFFAWGNGNSFSAAKKRPKSLRRVDDDAIVRRYLELSLRANYTCDHQIRELYQCHETTPANRVLRALAACQSDLCGARTQTAFCRKLVKEASRR
jgi:hypothetical protein